MKQSSHIWDGNVASYTDVLVRFQRRSTRLLGTLSLMVPFLLLIHRCDVSSVYIFHGYYKGLSFKLAFDHLTSRLSVPLMCHTILYFPPQYPLYPVFHTQSIDPLKSPLRSCHSHRYRVVNHHNQKVRVSRNINAKKK